MQPTSPRAASRPSTTTTTEWPVETLWFAVGPIGLLVFVWLLAGLRSGGWDLESLILGLGWIAVAEISLFAYMRRGQRQGHDMELSGDSVRATGFWRTRTALSLAAALAVLGIAIARSGQPMTMAALAGSAAVVLGLQRICAWSGSGESIPWSSIAVASGGAGVILLQVQGSGAWASFRNALIVVAFGTAIIMWLGLLARDVREVLRRP